MRGCYLPSLITCIILLCRTQAITQNINSQHPISFVNRSLAEGGSVEVETFDKS